jgi:serine/threonine protein kinase
MECCSGGDLHARKPYSESDANSISKQLLSAIRYMHDKGIVHRDLKFENIMWESPSSDIIKVSASFIRRSASLIILFKPR